MIQVGDIVYHRYFKYYAIVTSVISDGVYTIKGLDAFFEQHSANAVIKVSE